jgi:hypothetical protein
MCEHTERVYWTFLFFHVPDKRTGVWMLELIPFTEDEALISIFLGKRGKWFILEQIARVVFGWDVETLRRKLTFNSMTTQNK